MFSACKWIIKHSIYVKSVNMVESDQIDLAFAGKVLTTLILSSWLEIHALST